MANHLGLVHGQLIDNDCYSYMLEQWEKHGIDCWNLNDLIYEFGNIAVNEVLTEKYLVLDMKGNARLAFNIEGTISNLIMSFTQNQIYTFNELQDMFKQDGCSSGSLKSYLTFLENFGKVHYIELAATGISCFAAEDAPHLDKDFDMINSLSDQFDQRCVHMMDTEIGCSDIQFLR